MRSSNWAKILLCAYALLFACSKTAVGGAQPSSQPLVAPDTVRVATDLWPGFTESNGEGAYLHLLNLILPDTTQLQLHYTSFNRSIILVEQQQADMVIGVSVGDSAQLLLSDWPFDLDEIAVLFPAGTLQLENAYTLTGLRLATQRGYNYDQLLNLKVATYEVDSIQTGVSMVKSQRVDAFLVEKNELRNMLTTGDLAGLELRFLKGEPIYMGFADNSKGKQLKKWWDFHYQWLFHSGQLGALYQQYPNFILPEPTHQ